jgi:hypothetical protein
MEKKYKILVFIGILGFIVIVAEGVFLVVQQRQISKLLEPNGKVFGNVDAKQLDKLYREIDEQSKKENGEVFKKGFIESQNAASGLVENMSNGSFNMIVDAYNIDSINKADFSQGVVPSLTSIEKKISIKITDKTKMERSPQDGDSVEVLLDKSVLVGDLFEALEIKIIRTAEEAKKQLEAENTPAAITPISE